MDPNNNQKPFKMPKQYEIIDGKQQQIGSVSSTIVRQRIDDAKKSTLAKFNQQCPESSSEKYEDLSKLQLDNIFKAQTSNDQIGWHEQIYYRQLMSLNIAGLITKSTIKYIQNHKIY